MEDGLLAWIQGAVVGEGLQRNKQQQTATWENLWVATKPPGREIILQTD